MCFVYILYSFARDRYYIGITKNIEDRIRRHNSNHKGFTGGSGDWGLVWQRGFEDKRSALSEEKKIKGWKSRVKIEKLISSE